MSYDRISPTAWLVAYQRTLSDIPLSSEIFHELEALVQQTRSAAERERLVALQNSPSAVMWEARFKIINHVLNAYPADQVLEIAAGFSARGLEKANSPSVTYVELDLPGIVQAKQRIVENLIAQAKIRPPPNFHLVEGNALDLADVLSATHFFANKPVVVINEGLLPYLSHPERTTLARNIHTVLARFGGAWITPDIDIQMPEAAFGQVAGLVKERTAKIEQITGIDVLKNRFESEAVARVFFEQLGFQVERHSYLEVADQLVLPAQESFAKKAIERGVLFVMTVKGH